MPIYEVRRLDVVGNPEDGYEVDDTHRLGEVYIRPLDPEEQGENDRDLAIRADYLAWIVIEALVGGKWLSSTAPRAFERGELAVEEFAGIDGGMYVEETPVRGDRRPIISLVPQDFGTREHQGQVFWRTTIHVPATPGNGMPDEHQLEIALTLLGEQIESLVTVGDTEDGFVWPFEEWRPRLTLGFDPLTSEELRPTEAQVEQILVALDYSLETGDELDPRTGKAAARKRERITEAEVDHQLERAGVRFNRKRVGGADWSGQAVWSLGQNLYLFMDDNDNLSLLRRDMTADDGEIEEIAEGSPALLIRRARELL